MRRASIVRGTADELLMAAGRNSVGHVKGALKTFTGDHRRHKPDPRASNKKTRELEWLAGSEDALTTHARGK
ncbi:hypothetical protein MTP99_013368 [Tenebrio molitor]|jgi:hypothetical protein|nr:hypothetical protein MTP99_013368 [Tenebrio molitor]